MTHLMSRGHRAAAVLAAAALLPLLAACSGDPEDPAASDGVATTTTAATSAPDIDENGDPFCDLAVENVEVSNATVAKSNEIQTLLPGILAGTTDVASLNQWGDDFSALVSQTVAFYDEATPYVEGEPAAADFATMRGFVNDYSLGLAQLAANATDGSSFATSMQAFVTDPEMQTVLTEGPVAAQEVHDYIVDRCGAIA